MATKRLPPNDPFEWLNRARSNLVRAQNPLKGAYLEDFCFDAQQAAENSIKAVANRDGPSQRNREILPNVSIQESRMPTKSPVLVERVAAAILSLRGQKVILDSDLADLYGVTTTRLNEQVKRNTERFPADFMFRLSAQEFKDLISQSATSSSKWGGRRKLPLAFTEHGAVMAANVLNSPVAVAGSIEVVRAFVRLREILSTHKDLARKLEDLERKLGQHDEKFQIVFEAIRQLMAPASPGPKKPRIGFRPD
jgi:hypothetical protein